MRFIFHIRRLQAIILARHYYKEIDQVRSLAEDALGSLGPQFVESIYIFLKDLFGGPMAKKVIRNTLKIVAKFQILMKYNMLDTVVFDAFKEQFRTLLRGIEEIMAVCVDGEFNVEDGVNFNSRVQIMILSSVEEMRCSLITLFNGHGNETIRAIDKLSALWCSQEYIEKLFILNSPARIKGLHCTWLYTLIRMTRTGFNDGLNRIQMWITSVLNELEPSIFQSHDTLTFNTPKPGCMCCPPIESDTSAESAVSSTLLPEILQ